MTTRDKALEALDSRDWNGSVPAERATVSTVHSVRVDNELADWIASEADRRGVKPSAVIREALTTARAAATEDQTVTLRLSDLHRAINAMVTPHRTRAAT
jgi:hypothetical protein